MNSVPSTLATPSQWPCRKASKPQLMRAGLIASHTTPTRPPTSACEEDDGSDQRQVTRFHSVALPMPQRIRPRAWRAGNPAMSTMPPMVSATAVPPISGPA